MSTPTIPTSPCPTCSGEMQWRQNRTNKTWFQGCLKWPKCNGTRTQDGNDSRISSHVQSRLHRLLTAAVIHSEDECLTLTSEDLALADLYDLHIDEVAEDRSYVITIAKRKE